MTGAQAIRAASRDRFALAQWDIEVMRGEGGVHLRVLMGGLPGGDVSLANAFAGPETAAELRAIADHLEGLTWD